MIEKGSTVFQEEPFSFVLHRIHNKQRCDACLQRCNLQMCNGCSYVGYCSASCKENNSIIHEKECQLIKNVNGQFLDDVRLVARIIAKLRDGGGNIKHYYTETEYRTFYDLATHEEDIQKDKQRMAEFDELYANLRIFLGEDNVPTRNKVFEIFARLIINSYEISGGPFDSIGTAVYIVISILDHSCAPNLIYVYDGPKIIITAVEDIPENNWRKMTVPYVVMSEATEKRRKLLKENYYFDCHCSKCEKSEFKIACPNATCDYACQPDEQNCFKCNIAIPSTMKNNYNNVIKQSMEILQWKEFINYSVIKECLIMQKEVLHKSNTVHLKILKLAYDLAKKESRWKDAEFYLENLITGYSKHYTLLNLSYILMHLDLARTYFEQKKVEQYVSVINQVKPYLYCIYNNNVTNILHELKDLFPCEILNILR